MQALHNWANILLNDHMRSSMFHKAENLCLLSDFLLLILTPICFTKEKKKLYCRKQLPKHYMVNLEILLKNQFN